MKTAVAAPAPDPERELLLWQILDLIRQLMWAKDWWDKHP